jgi:outer membrane protein
VGSKPAPVVSPGTKAAPVQTAPSSSGPNTSPNTDSSIPNPDSGFRPDPESIDSQITPEKALISPIFANNQNRKALDLQTCFRLTAVRDDTLKINLQNILISRAQLSQQIAAFYPTFTVNNSQEFLHYLQSEGGFNIVNGAISSGVRNYQSNSNVAMNYTVFNGGQNINNYFGARDTIAAKKFTLERTYQTIYQSVAQAFYQVLQYEGDITVLQDLVKALQARVVELQDRVAIGRSRPAELLQAEVTLATTRVTIEQTKGSLASARETLAYYIGIPSDRFEVKETQTLPEARPLELYLERTHARPDILAQLETLHQTEHALWAARGQLLPTVTANGNYLASQDPTNNTVDATMTIQISAPIFDGGLIIGMINQNRETVKQTRFQLDDLYRTSDETTRQAYAALNSSLAQVAVLREAVRLSAENFQGQLSDYRKGVVQNLDVLTALQDFQSTRQSLHDADMGARINLINLYVASGLAAREPGADNRALPIHDTYYLTHHQNQNQ